MNFEAVIGLEVHAQLKTRTKIFCGCSTLFGAPPNTHTCPVCLGMPGVLPVLNRRVVEYALRMALATGCGINRRSQFARKNYFYPDLPKGYQISQYDLPIAEHGRIALKIGETARDGVGETVRDGVGETVRDRGGETARDRGGETARDIGITRIHMEEDAGKLSHDPHRPLSRVDLNRTGVPLIEIVSEPDLRTPEEAGAYLRQLRSILRYLDICDGNMEEGSFRCDANVSQRPAGSDTLGTRTEIKNLNSFKHVEKALAYEIQRQREVLSEGGAVIQETRLWDPDKSRTTSMRGKEEAHDYRYFPDPDLVPLVLDDDWIETIRKDMPELPDQKRARFQAQFQLPAYDAGVLTADRQLADYFEACLDEYAAPKQVANWIMGPLLGVLHAEGIPLSAAAIAPRDLARLVRLIDDGTISGKIAKTVFEEMARSGRGAREIVEARGLVQVSDPDALQAMVSRVLDDHPEQVAEYRAGKTKVLGFLMGRVMQNSRGKANPKVVNDLLRSRLEL